MHQLTSGQADQDPRQPRPPQQPSPGTLSLESKSGTTHGPFLQKIHQHYIFSIEKLKVCISLIDVCFTYPNRHLATINPTTEVQITITHMHRAFLNCKGLYIFYAFLLISFYRIKHGKQCLQCKSTVKLSKFLRKWWCTSTSMKQTEARLPAGTVSQL